MYLLTLKSFMAIAMNTGYSAQTEGALLSNEIPSNWVKYWTVFYWG